MAPQPDGRERFWNGNAWTENFREEATDHNLPLEPASLPVPGPAPGKGGFYKPWMGYIGAALVALLVGVGIGSSGDSAASAAAAPAVTTTVKSIATMTATATATATVTATASPTPTAAAPAPARPASTPAPQPPEKFVMPKLVGENLQLAQDKLQKLGSFLLDQQDAAGLDRFALVDSNWKVCSQKPKAGARIPIDTMVVLAAVKLDESCP